MNNLLVFFFHFSVSRLFSFTYRCHFTASKIKMSAKGDGDNISDEFDSTETNFARPAEKTIQEIVNADAGDESLRNYKEKLLGTAAISDAVVVRPDNPEKVIVTNISLLSDGEVKRSMDLPARDDFSLAVKEGCIYHIRIQYYVQREIVSGLRYTHKVKRLGMPRSRSSTPSQTRHPSHRSC